MQHVSLVLQVPQHPHPRMHALVVPALGIDGVGTKYLQLAAVDLRAPARRSFPGLHIRKTFPWKLGKTSSGVPACPNTSIFHIAMQFLAVSLVIFAIHVARSILPERSCPIPPNLWLARLATRRHSIDDAIGYYHNAIYGAWAIDPDKNRRQARFELIEFLPEKMPARKPNSSPSPKSSRPNPEQHLTVAHFFVLAFDHVGDRIKACAQSKSWISPYATLLHSGKARHPAKTSQKAARGLLFFGRSPRVSSPRNCPLQFVPKTWSATLNQPSFQYVTPRKACLRSMQQSPAKPLFSPFYCQTDAHILGPLNKHNPSKQCRPEWVSGELQGSTQGFRSRQNAGCFVLEPEEPAENRKRMEEKLAA